MECTEGIMAPTKVRVATCVPLQKENAKDKTKWLDEALAKTDCDLFLLSQEYYGGHYIEPNHLHYEQRWIDDTVGGLAQKHHKHIGVGACVKHDEGATEDYIYYSSNGTNLGHHKKYALPAYDHILANGHGKLVPETNYARRTTPIEIPSLGLRVGTIFCWEVFSQTVWGAYSLANCNLIAHPIKFAPRGWLKKKEDENGVIRVTGFDQNAKNNDWLDKLKFESKFAMMPIAVTCNSWAIGTKFMAFVGWIDELIGSSDFHEVPSTADAEKIVVIEYNPKAFTHSDLTNAGAYQAAVGSQDGFGECRNMTMATKIRRLEAHMIGGTSEMDLKLLAAKLKTPAAARQKKSTLSRFKKLEREEELPTY
jgi:hypothetical protein